MNRSDPIIHLDRYPAKPGVYLMKNVQGRVLYVGKAKHLRRRISSYFKASGRRNSPKTRMLLRQVVVVDTIITGNEKEALILESNLIKKHRPRYNVVLKDDKRYPALRIDLREPYPRLALVRKIGNDGAHYFGPYSSAAAVHQTLKFIHRHFKIRRCKNSAFRARSRPCLHYQMGGCYGPCSQTVDTVRYHEMVQDVILFLKGRTPELVRKIQQDMQAAAHRQSFEKAAVLRDRMLALEKTLEKQRVTNTDGKDRDALGLAVGKSGSAMITILAVRGGFLNATRHYEIQDTAVPQSEILSGFIRQYYTRTHFLPKEILVSSAIEKSQVLAQWLAEQSGQRVAIHHPQRGPKAALVRLALENAQKELQQRLAARDSDRAIAAGLQKILKLDQPPERVECFDNSHLSGRQPVAARVVFENARPLRSQYRHYHIQSGQGADDYASMAEVLTRRFSKNETEAPLPDVLLVDGGKGQLNVAGAILEQLGLKGRMVVLGIAKKDVSRGEKEDKIYRLGRTNALQMDRHRDLLLFFMRVRDEAHRFAISFQRQRHRKKMTQSRLDAIAGVGHQRKKLLMQHFGSLEAIGQASVEKLSALPGISRALAEKIRTELTSSPNG